MQRHHVGGVEQLLERDERDAVHRARQRRATRPAEQAHAEPRPESRHLRADRAQADDAERLAPQLHSHEAPGLPAPFARAHERRTDVPREGQDHGQRVLGHRGGAVVRRVGDGDAPARGLGHVDAAVVTDAEKADEAQALTRAQDLGVHLGVVEDDRLGRTQALDQRRAIGRRAVVEVHLPELAQRLELRRVLHAASAVGKDDPHVPTRSPPSARRAGGGHRRSSTPGPT